MSNPILIDPEDKEKIESLGCKVIIDEKGYAVIHKQINNRGYNIKVHRLVMGLKRGDKRQVDHINHNTLDNRKCNLRIVTNGQNQMNRTGVLGIYFYKTRNKWRAGITFKGKVIHLGYFSKREDAINARKQAERFYFKEYAYA